MANSLNKLIGIAGLTALGSSIYLGRRQIIARMLKLPPPTYKVEKEPDLHVIMPDSIELATDLYRPAGLDNAPTVLMRTPYGRKSINQFFAMIFAERGFNVVSQDVRGRFDSEDEFEPYVHEASDGEATLAWIAEQPWSNGRIGMWGQSYVGFVQWAAASTGTPHLHAMMPAITQSNLGGPNEQGFIW
ncbi:MAG: CocE/NonD family hydrolase, partial [Anaerolineales bacterium]|nr:CocE/NonD family hydrolase [Anaerolineales bacterium]